jgi:cobalt-zinc-cadmium resistance protein CzcA
MLEKIINYSIHNKLIVLLFTAGIIGFGLYSLANIPIGAVPDVTNNQVQVITNSPNLTAPEIEKFITVPVELALQNLPNVVELRSISRFGFSMVTVVFEDDMGTYLPRELVAQQLKMAETEIPNGLGTPEMTPISSGLGEVYQYTLFVKEGFEDKYDAMTLREIQDWIVKRQLSGIKGVIEVNSFGGKLKQYEVTINPSQLKAMNVTMTEVFDALENSNENTGGSYIEKDPNAYFIRSEGLVENPADIEKIVVKNQGGTPILIRDVAKVKLGFAPRFGALTRNGDGEVVGGIVMMLKGENAAQVMERVEERVQQVRKSLPEGVEIQPYLVRSKLINNAIHTVEKNLLEGGLIVIFILVLLLGNWRAGLIVASVIPLAMLFAVSLMNIFGVTANLMSLGAIDFGLIVDGAVIIVEAIVYRLSLRQANNETNSGLTQEEMDETVTDASIKIRSSAAFGEIIILIVYLPILALSGIEGKTFAPMAQTVSFAILGALILSLTYVPMMSALFLSKKNTAHGNTFSDKIIGFLQWFYTPILKKALQFKTIILTITLLLFGVSLWKFTTLGGEFIPTLEEGDLALHQILPPGSSLEKSVEVSGKLQNILMENFPEVEQVVTKIGTAEIPTDLMSMETGDIMVILKPKAEWTSASTREELMQKMEQKMKDLPGISYEFTQPIQMRFNELMTGSRADIAIKIYGDDLNLLFQNGKKIERLVENLKGVSSVTVDQIIGMPQIIVRYDYSKLAQYGLQVKTVNTVVRTAFAGEKAGVIYEGERRFDLVVRLPEAMRKDIENVRNLLIPLSNGQSVPLSQIAAVNLEKALMQISRDNTKRKITVGVNVLDRDVTSLVNEIQAILDDNLELPPGYFITYGGQFENFQNATKRLTVAVPVALLLIFALLYLTFNSFKQATLIFTAIPLAAIGGIWALVFRGMPFSISAGIGFIALFGVAVLNGIVLIGYFNQLKKEGFTDVRQRILFGTKVRLRPVIMTALVASLGFLPMALSMSGGAEVQRPLATVVIGGLITATLLTLVVLPILYEWIEKEGKPQKIQ